MSLINSLKRVRNETPISSLFSITHLNSPSYFESKQGYLGAVLKIQGIPSVISEAAYLNQMTHRLHQALLHLDERFILYVTVHRRKENIMLEGEFKSAFANQVHEKYHARFQDKNLYCNAIYLTLVYKGDTSSKVARSLSLMEKLKEASLIEEKARRREANLDALTMKVEQLKASLSSFTPHLLGEQDDVLGYSELLEFLSLFPNGGEPIQFKRPASSPALAQSLSEALPNDCLYPEGHLGQYLSAKHIFFGSLIQFQGAVKEDKRFATLLSLKQ